MAIVKINERSKLGQSLIYLDCAKSDGKTALSAVLLDKVKAKINERKSDAEQFADGLSLDFSGEEIEVWQNELDMLGTNSATEKYVEMLAKAPAGAPSLRVLTNFVQQRMSA